MAKYILTMAKYILAALAAAVVCIDCGGKAAKTLTAETGGGVQSGALLAAAAEDTAARVDADYCVDFRKEKGPRLSLAKKYNGLTIRTVEGDEPIECESSYNGYGQSAEMAFIDKSGKSIKLYSGYGGRGWFGWSSNCGGGDVVVRGPFTLPVEIEREPPSGFSLWNIGMLKEEEKKESVFRELLQPKGRIIDGYVSFSPHCDPVDSERKLEYKVKFRARITGECDCDLLDEDERNQRRYITELADSIQTVKSGAAIATLSPDGTLTVSGNGAMEDYHFADNAGVWRIESPWNSVAYQITRLVIEDGVTHIGNDAFRKFRITSVTLPKSVTSIGDRAFAECRGLTSVTLPNGVTSIGEEAFMYCDELKSITFPNSVKSIGMGAFSYCDSLKSVTIPGGVVSIGSGAFYFCDSLTSITVAADNAHYSSVDGILFNKNKTALIQYLRSRQGHYTIPDGVASIGDRAFAGCYDLTSVTIPNSVTSIGKEAFYRCIELTSVALPNGVTSIGERAFQDCYRMASVRIPNSVTSIGDEAFERCHDLASVTIPNGVKSVGEDVFSQCRRLKSVTLPNSVTSVEDGAFSYCDSLKSVTIPNGVTKIGNKAFYNSGLTSIAIPDSVTKIGYEAFGNCGGLTAVNVGKGNPKYSSVDGVLFDKAQKTLLLYPNAKRGAYAIPEGVTKIAWGAFYDCSRLTSLTIPKSVAAIRKYEFFGSDSLTSITVAAENARYSSEDGVLFDKDKTALIRYPASKRGDSYTIPNSVATVKAGAFGNSANLTSVTIGENAASIEERAFRKCRALKSITVLNPKPPKLGENVFYGIDWKNACIYIPASGMDNYFDTYRTYNWKENFKCIKEI